MNSMEYQAHCREMRLGELVREVFYLAKANDESQQWKINILYQEVKLRELLYDLAKGAKT